MGASSSSEQAPREWPMRCRSQDQVPKCFRYVTCPYPKAQTAYGTYGAINYSFVGHIHNEVVVCFHGLNGSRMMYQDFGDYVSRHGDFCVLSFDLYGHGLSNAPEVDLCCLRGCCPTRSSASSRCTSSPPRGRYDLDFFVDQTDELLRLLGLGDRQVNLLGFSLGGAIAVAFAHRYPHKVTRLLAMSPSGFIPKIPASYYLLKACWCCLIPLAPHLLCTCWYKRERFARSLKSEDQEVGDEVVENLWSRFVWQLYVKRGVASATLAALHRIPWFTLRHLFTEVGKHRRPVLLIWGEFDTLNPPETVAEEVKSCFSNVQLLVAKNAGHIALCDQPREVILSILSFLQMPADIDLSAADPREEVPPKQQADQISQWVSPGGPPVPEYGENVDADTPQGAAVPGALGQATFADRAVQMPVPMVLGHSDMPAPPAPSGDFEPRYLA